MDRFLLYPGHAMRLLRAAGLALLLAVPIAAAAIPANVHAEAAAKSKKPRTAGPPYRVVRILPETTQALLFDKRKGKHVLVDVGQQLPGFAVVEIEEDQVVLTRTSDGKDFVLVSPEGAPPVAPAQPLSDPYADAGDAKAKAPPAEPLIDPYSGVLDPYGSEGVREVKAPEGQRAGDPPAKADPPTKVDPPKADPPAKVEPPKVDPPKDQAISISRAELDAGLGDFVKIGKEVDMAVVSDGVELRRVAKDSFFHRMGLRAGDKVKKVDGKVIKSLDDAASVYARLGKAKSFTVEVLRAGVTITLRYTITG